MQNYKDLNKINNIIININIREIASDDKKIRKKPVHITSFLYITNMANMTSN